MTARPANAADAKPDAGGDPFIATENPYWELGPDSGGLDSYRAFFRRVGRALPAVLALLRRASGSRLLALLGCQLAAGSLWAYSLVLGARLIESLLRTPQALSAPLLPLDGQVPQPLALTLLSLIAAYLAKLGIDALAEHLRARLSPTLIALAEQDFVDACLRAPLQRFDDPDFVDRMHRARDRGLHYVESVVDQAVALSAALMGLLSGVAALAMLHLALLPVLLLCLLPQAWSSARALLCVQSHWDHSMALSRQSWMLQELASQAEPAAELRSLQMEGLLSQRHRQVGEALRTSLSRLKSAVARTRAWGAVLSGIAQGLAYLWLLLLVQRGVLGPGLAGAAALGLRASLDAVGRLVQALDQMAEKALYLDDFFAFVQQSQAEAKARGPALPPAQAPQCISLHGLGFAYAGAPERPVLQDIELSIRRGTTVALVGENGSGKSTLAKLLAGLYVPSQGSICWDGVDCQLLDLQSRLAQTMIVQQHPLRWPYSAEQNVRLGRIDAEALDPAEADQRLQAAAVRAQADAVIAQLPQRWQTLLNRLFKGGLELSAGQWQRLAVARGLYRDAPLMIWDEPTAPLDARAEAAVYESLASLRRQRTVVLISHRLASVRGADMIFFLRQGRITERGTHQQLMALNGDYAQLYQLQLRLTEAADDAGQTPAPAEPEQRAAA
ncbi:ABC transporter ATP-binding protein/permease [Paucibacter sp. APW11]|uniref:ABC transporter ATP-binding protein/permease n=1 Tax=Roseateles aquae TaxID=3077235 RepID=A0ABU3P5L1_9BURK|nr:ABC transporter ATP-binding protein/permease [Paucibacter sp. APW11]MDT8997864.1 ABC transporter ATP-binding protein/permease [Paucibacter sp. APW11]